MRHLIQEIADDSTSPKLLPALALGLVIGILLVVVGVSFAAMIFSGSLSPLATRGAGLTLFGGVSLCGFLAFSSSFRSTISTPQDAPVAVLATIGAPVVAAMGMADTNATFSTMLAIMAISTFATGISFTIIGQLKLTKFFRFMPYPVVGGFLAGGGLMLVKGGISVMSSLPVELGTLGILFESSAQIKWMPGAAYAITLWLVLKRWSHFLILPFSIAAVTIAYYFVFHALGISVTEARETGFLLSGVPSSGLWPAFSFADLHAIRWDVVLDQVPTIATVVLVTMMGLLLNISGLELGSDTDINFDKEFRNAGIANMLGGFGGSAPGSHTLSLSLLCNANGAYTRLAGLTTAAVIAFVLFAGGSALEYFPKPVLGGLLVFIGIDILDNWLLSTRRKIPLSDYLVLGIIFLVICFYGFIEGVSVGLAITVVLFIIRFSSVDIIRDDFTALNRRSRKGRSIPQQTILRQHGAHIQGYTLSGYLFFGSASILAERLKQGLRQSPKPWSFLLDFKGVSGFDVSAANAFQRFIVSAQDENAHIVIADASARFIQMLKRILPAGNFEKITFTQDIDRGLEACEEIVLTEYTQRSTTNATTPDSLFDQSVDDVMAHLDRQVMFEELVEALRPWLEECSYDVGTPLARNGETQQGLQMLTWGSATIFDRKDGIRMANIGAGDIIAPQAAFTAFVATQYIEADTMCRTMVLSPEARNRLEQDSPELALQLDRYILSA